MKKIISILLLSGRLEVYKELSQITVFDPTVLHTEQINFHAVDVNKYRYIQTPIGLLIFEVIGHVYPVQCEVLPRPNKKQVGIR